MSSTSAVLVFAIGAAFLGFWTVARFPSFGPQTFRTALPATVAVFMLQSPLPSLVRAVVDTAGVAPALLFVVLPALTLLFWTSGCLVRSLVAMFAPHQR